MSEAVWRDIDAVITQKLRLSDPALDAALAANAQAGLPGIDVSPPQGRLLELLVRMCGARRVLEVGTLGGYSTICLARGLQADGRLTTLEFAPRHAEVARANIARAGLSGRVDIRVGPALELLPALGRDGAGPFDFVFLDADKPNNPVYADWAIRLGSPGTVIVVDNVIYDGLPAREAASASGGARTLFDGLGADARLTATAIQTVGSKGHDGFVLAVVN